MRKMISLVIAVLMLTGTLAGCGQSDVGKDNVGKDDKLSIVATIFPEYDWVMNILGDKTKDADVTMLLDSGVDLHSYQPTADDIIKISTCDVFLYVGGESDEWVEDALKGAANKDRVVINLMDSLGDTVKEEEIVEGMEEEVGEEETEEKDAEEKETEEKNAEEKETEEKNAEEKETEEKNAEEKETEEKDAEEKETEEDGEGGEEDPEYDEHVWLSLRNAAVLCDVIKDALGKADADNAEVYASNAAAYIEKLNDLDAEYQAAVDAANRKTLLFGDRFPFRYLTDDYGLSYYAAFAGCSAETEASFETVAFLAGKVDELGLPCVLTLEGTDHEIAKTVVAATSAKSARILSMDSMQSATAEDMKNGVNYLSIMENNLEVLKEALK